MLESPITAAWNTQYMKYNEMFNWTMTYRDDSDIPFKYGEISPKQKSSKKMATKNYTAILSSKSRDVAWIVSHCTTHSKREAYVQELSRYVAVDIYGACNNKTQLPCSRDWKSGCSDFLNKTYKFYLSFENSICKGYITEKLYQILPLNVIPVVRGPDNYRTVVPYKWYINTADFKSPRHLAAYLRLVGSNPELYASYLRGREDYNIYIMNTPRDHPAWCTLCERLNNPAEPSNIYKRIDRWWGQHNCHLPGDLPH